MARQLYQPHDNLFRKVFADATEAAGLLRPNLPKWLSTTLDWSTLTLQDRSYVDEALEASQSDLLFEVQRQAGAGPEDTGEAQGEPTRKPSRHSAGGSRSRTTGSARRAAGPRRSHERGGFSGDVEFSAHNQCRDARPD